LRKAKNIFLVEDDEDDQQFFKEAIKDIDETICLGLAVNGVDALAKLGSMSILPDLIFMDINMPLMNGLDCLKKLKSLVKFQNIPVVILTTSSIVLNRQLPFTLEANSYLKKPSDSLMLKKNIADMMNIYIPAAVVA